MSRYLLLGDTKCISTLQKLPLNILNRYKISLRNTHLTSFLAFNMLNIWLQERQYPFNLEEIAFRKNKPYFPYRNLEFSISHSLHKVAVLIDESSYSVGVDIEHNLKANIHSKLIHKYGSPEEIVWFDTSLKKIHDFYLSWCSKEAILKSCNIGVSHLTEIQFLPLKKKFITSLTNGTIHFYSLSEFYLAYFVHYESPLICLQLKNNTFFPYSLPISNKFKVDT